MRDTYAVRRLFWVRLADIVEQIQEKLSTSAIYRQIAIFCWDI